MKKIALLAVLGLFAAGCGDDPPPVKEVPKVEPPKPVAKVEPVDPTGKSKPLTDAQKSALAADWAKATEMVKSARAYKAQGELIEKSQGRAAANDTLVKAKDLYHQAAELMSPWLEPEDPEAKLNEAQIKQYMETYRAEWARWGPESKSMGPVHKD